MIIDDDRSPDQTPRPGATSEIEQLRTLLYTDDLTGLYNRRFFRHCVEEQKSSSDSTGAPFALLIMDIDHFKQINDNYGHAIGDAALIKVAKVLKEQLREYGWVFRYAGDEFVGIVRTCDEETARSVCGRILNQVSLGFVDESDGFPLKSISLSIGFAIYPNDGGSISPLFQAADAALYASKQGGRNCYHSAREISATERDQAGAWPVRVHCESLVGRQQQWNQLQTHFAECKAGRGRLSFVTGEAGIGKSRLLRQFCRRQRAGDYHILYGECTEGTIIHSYAPIRDALKKGFEAKDPATVNLYRQLDDHYRRELITLVPQFDRFEKQPLTEAPSQDRYFLLESILLLLQSMSRQLPTVLVLEDIHWSDAATLNLIQYLARNIRNERILLIATFREEEAVQSSLPGIIQNMSREKLFEAIPLKPLSREETELMVEEIFHGYNVYDSFKSWIYEETEGIPFYIEELVKLLLEEGYIARFGNDIEARKPDKFLLPYSIRALIQRRINRLNESLQRVLAFASIIGYEFDLQILVKLTEENEGYLLDLLEQLTRQQLIREISSGHEERFAFSHNKIRDVIYEDMGLIKRKKFHRRVAEILESNHAEELPLYAEDLAYHYEQAGVMTKAFAYSLDAGKKALQIHAYGDAHMHFDRCNKYRELFDSSSSGLAVDLYTNQGLALEALGSWDESIRSYDRLLNLRTRSSSPTLEADAFNHLSRVYYKKEDFHQSLRFAEQALESAKRREYSEGICAAYYSLGKNFWRICDYGKALEYLVAAIEMTPKGRDPLQKAKFLNSAGIIYLEKSDYANALECFQQAQEIFQERSDKPGVIECLVNISIVRQTLGNVHEARQYVVNAFALAQEVGDPFSIAACAVNQAELELDLGNFEMAERLNERAGRIYNELSHSLGQTYFLQNESHYHMILGHLEASLEAAQKARAIAEDKSLHKRVAELLRQEAAVHYYRGDYVQSLECINKVQQISQEIHDPVGLAESALKLGFIYITLKNPAEALKHWGEGLDPQLPTPSHEFLFWKTAAEVFQAAIGGRFDEAAIIQNEMRTIAKKTENAYLIAASHVLAAVQLEAMRSPLDALMQAEKAEKHAQEFRQELWLPRARIRLYELKHKLQKPVSATDIFPVLESAKKQGQHDIVHRCFFLLREIDPSLPGLKEDFQKHWDSWKNCLPAECQPNFAP